MSKPEKVRVIIINAETRTIREETIDNTLEAKQAIVGGLIELATVLPSGDDVFVNEEGLYMFDRFFYFTEGAPHPYAGNAVIVGHDGEGGCIDASSKAEDFDDKVIFMSREDVRKFVS